MRVVENALNTTFFDHILTLSDCDLKYHFGPKVLEYGRKKLYLVRFLQLAFVMTSPLNTEFLMNL